MTYLKRLLQFSIFLLILVFAGTGFSYQAQIKGSIPLTDNIKILTVNPIMDSALAISSDSQNAYLIDLLSNSVSGTIHLNIVPAGAAIDTNRNIAVISSQDGILNFIDMSTNELVKTISVGKSVYAVAFDQVKDKIILGGDNSLMILNPDTDGIEREISVPGKIFSMGVDAEFGQAAVIINGKNGLLVTDIIDGKSQAWTITDEKCTGVSVNASTHMGIFIADSDSSVYVMSLDSKSVVASNTISDIPKAVAVDTTRNTAVVATTNGITFLQLENPVPVISELIPASTQAAGPGFDLSVKGQKFLRDSMVTFNTKVMDTQFQDNSQLRAFVPSSELMLTGTLPITVLNSKPGGGSSNALYFNLLNPAPVISSVTPGEMLMTDPMVEIQIQGRNFLPSATVMFNGGQASVTYKSSILLVATIKAAGITVPGNYPLTVTNHSLVSLVSNTAFVNVTDSISAASTNGNSNGNSNGNQDNKNKPAQTGTLTGNIYSSHQEPIKGVTVVIRNLSTTTDAQGHFELKDVPAGKVLMMVHGSTAENTLGTYEPFDHFPTIPFTVDIAPDTVTALPYNIYLHRQKNWNFAEIDPGQDTVLTDPDLPGVELRIPKGVNITGWDGNHNQRVSVRTVAPDRLPVKPLPDNAHARSVYMFYFDKIGGGIADKPIPFKAPNDLGLLPGQKAILWFYDESPNEGEAPNDWAIAGTGTVTPDGMSIVTDPGVGIPKFCCGATTFGPSGAPYPRSGPRDPGAGPDNQGGDPIDLANGYFFHEVVDYKVPGIIPAEIKRYYRSGEGGTGAYGSGTYYGYDWWLGLYNNMLLLIEPGDYQYNFAVQSDGVTYLNTTDPKYIGDVITKNADGTYTLKKKNGWIYNFTGNLLSSIVDPNGNALTFVRGSDGNTTKILTQEGQEIDFTYNSSNYMTGITGPAGTVNYTYSSGRLQSVTYADGSSYTYQYDSSGRMSQVTRNGNLVVSNQYDTNNRVTQQTLADGSIYSYSYTIASGNVTQTSMTAPNSAVTTWRFYDNSGTYRNGYITSVTTPDGTTTYNRTAGTNLITSITDPLNRTTSMTYYSNGLVNTKTDPLGNKTTYVYESSYGYPTQITDALGNSTTISYTYDSNNRITKAIIKDPLNHQTTINYNSNGVPSSRIDPNSNTIYLYYENVGWPTQLTRVVDPLGNTIKMTYDNFGRLLSRTDGNGKSAYYTYDIMDRIKSVTDANGNITQYEYDANGNLVLVFDPAHNMIQYAYDNRNRLIQMTDQLGRSETYTYYTGSAITPSTGNNLKSFTDRKGQVITYTQYDPMNRLKMTTYQDGSTIQYTYDAAGRVTAINDSISGVINYTFNDFGCTNCSGRGLDQIAEEKTSLGTIDYTYDADGRRVTMTVTGQQPVTYVYDASGRMTSLFQKIGSSTRTYTMGYDAASRRTSLQIPTSTKNKYVTNTYSPYDAANHLLGLTIQGPSAQIENLSYTYDPAGNRLSFKRTAAEPAMSSISNISYDAANEMLGATASDSSAQSSMTYDYNGNLVIVTNACGKTTYTWDARNRLTGINGYTPSCSLLTASFGYDALNRRISKTVNGITTQYVYDGLDIIQEKQGVAINNYIRTLSNDEPLTRIKADGTIRHFVRDALGSVIALTDDSGVIKTTYLYDPFGNTTVTGEASDNPFQFTGREYDNTGVYYYRARYYSAELQRFISEDPIGLTGGINYYRYVGNGPVNYIDPLGLMTCVLQGCSSTAPTELRREYGDWNFVFSHVMGPTPGPGGGPSSYLPFYTIECIWKRKYKDVFGYQINCISVCTDGCGRSYKSTSTEFKTYEVKGIEQIINGATLSILQGWGASQGLADIYCKQYMHP